MKYPYFSRNGEILPIDQAVISLDNIEFTYGYGVYETVRVSKKQIHFLDDHAARLLESARLIGLQHNVTLDSFKKAAQSLVDKIDMDAYNLKVLLIGASTAEGATLYIECLSPYFPDRKMYKQGVACITRDFERFIPHAKTLNMLPSYMAYRDARAAGCYDALLINRRGCITEGTRTNFFCLNDKTIFTPPESEILLGVTRKHILDVADKEGFEIIEKDIRLESVGDYQAAFLTSTSTKIVPIRKIDTIEFLDAPTHLVELMKAYDKFAANE
jgi:branched-subunit amino acid aminotransferase/4-amino-4-deoxychorismate lyase